MHPNCRRGSLPKIRGSRLSAVPFCISILTSVRRIVKIAVRFLHTKTALCDRKDTQSRFAVNAARSIVCVETVIMRGLPGSGKSFQCRTQHCVCWDNHIFVENATVVSVSMPHAALCVSRPTFCRTPVRPFDVSMPHAALCVLGQLCVDGGVSCREPFQCRTQHCVCWDAQSGNEYVVANVFQCRTQHCVCWDKNREQGAQDADFMFQCRTQHCVCRDSKAIDGARVESVFQCRTQHCVCRDMYILRSFAAKVRVSMPHAALCVSGPRSKECQQRPSSVSMPHAALCVSGLIFCNLTQHNINVSMPHAALCVSGRCVPQPLSRAG